MASNAENVFIWWRHHARDTILQSTTNGCYLLRSPSFHLSQFWLFFNETIKNKRKLTLSTKNTNIFIFTKNAFHTDSKMPAVSSGLYALFKNTLYCNILFFDGSLWFTFIYRVDIVLKTQVCHYLKNKKTCSRRWNGLHINACGKIRPT